MAAIEWHEYLDWHSLSVMMRRADVVITHAGVGSAVMAIRAGKTPVMVPRLARFGEHVDDHQLQLAERFAQRGLALACRPEDDLKALVTRARTRAPSAPAARPAELRSAVVAAASAA
jgi:UDP-N-acetylglucosamine transferase subunit ALG13